MKLHAIIHGIRIGWKRLRCKHPAMAHATITVVGGGYCVGIWYCPDCGKTLPEGGVSVS